jgi:uncharacterized protein (TIGR02145 family)
MEKIYQISVICLICSCQLFAQNNIILTFTGVNNGQPVTLDYVWIKNLTRSCDTTLPQGVMTINLGPVGLNEHKNVISDKLRVLEISSNPFIENCEISLFMPDQGLLMASVNEMNGRTSLVFKQELPRGTHRFRFTAGNQSFYILTFGTAKASTSVKLFPAELNNHEIKPELIKTQALTEPKLKNSIGRGFEFTPGDELMLVGHSGDLESGTIQKPNHERTVTLQFASGIPCPGLPTVVYEGKTYHTVQIRSQCWLKENIDLGNQVDGTIAQSDNGVIEKYCFNDDAGNCTLYGGLYQWSEMMKYISDSVSIQGICPGDWHVATDLEWMVLEGAVDSQYGIGDPFWWHDMNRGFDAGKNLKSTTGWKDNGSGTDLYGFTALPGGIHHDDNTYIGLTKYGCFWTSSRSISVFASHARLIDYYYNLVYRDQYERTEARSVRCIKNY